MAKTVGIMPPPMKPWIARHTIISSILDDVPHIRLVSVKSPALYRQRPAHPRGRIRPRHQKIRRTSNRIGHAFDRCNGCHVGFHWIKVDRRRGLFSGGAGLSHNGVGGKR